MRPLARLLAARSLSRENARSSRRRFATGKEGTDKNCHVMKHIISKISTKLKLKVSKKRYRLQLDVKIDIIAFCSYRIGIK